MALQVDIDRLGTDVELPEDPEGTLPKTPSGDLRLISGRPNLQGALRRRAVTNPGALVFRPDFGAGLALALEEPATPTTRSLIASRVRRQLLQDGRVREARARVREGTEDEGLDSDVTVVSVAYRIVDDTQDELTISPRE